MRIKVNDRRDRYHVLNTDNPCWTCKYALKIPNNPCPWSTRFEPVPGWDATAKTTKSSRERIVESYRIDECPLYEWDGTNTLEITPEQRVGETYGLF